MSAVADTGFVLAVANTSDKWHSACLEAYRQHSHIYLPQSTLAEVAYMLTQVGGNSVTARFILGLPQTRYRIIALESQDLIRTAELLTQYEDARIDFVDVTIVAVAERLKLDHILTIDRRDFDIVRPNHVEHFILQPS